MFHFNYSNQSVVKRFLKKIANNNIEKNFLLTHKEVRFLAYQIRTDWQEKKLNYGEWETNREISYWLDRLCEYGIPHTQRSRIARHLLKLLNQAAIERPEDLNDVFDSSSNNEEFEF